MNQHFLKYNLAQCHAQPKEIIEFEVHQIKLKYYSIQLIDYTKFDKTNA